MESSWGFTEQVRACSMIAGDQSLEHLFLDRTSLHCQKVGKSLPCREQKLHVTNCSRKPKCMFKQKSLHDQACHNNQEAQKRQKHQYNAKHNSRTTESWRQSSSAGNKQQRKETLASCVVAPVALIHFGQFPVGVSACVHLTFASRTCRVG